MFPGFRFVVQGLRCRQYPDSSQRACASESGIQGFQAHNLFQGVEAKV